MAEGDPDGVRPIPPSSIYGTRKSKLMEVRAIPDASTDESDGSSDECWADDDSDLDADYIPSDSSVDVSSEDEDVVMIPEEHERPLPAMEDAPSQGHTVGVKVSWDSQSQQRQLLASLEADLPNLLLQLNKDVLQKPLTMHSNPIEFVSLLLTEECLEDITFQTGLFRTQKDIECNTNMSSRKPWGSDSQIDEDMDEKKKDKANYPIPKKDVVKVIGIILSLLCMVGSSCFLKFHGVA